MENILALIIVAILTAMIMAVVTAFPIMILWNALLPELFGFHTISFWQAFGLSILARILVGTSNNPSSGK